MILLLVACYPESSIKRGLPESGDSSWDWNMIPDSEDSQPGFPLDTAPDSAPPESTPPSSQACYMGEDRLGTTCFDTIPFSSSWGSDYNYPEPYSGSDQYLAPVRYLDLEAIDLGTQIAPNFSASEFLSASKGRYGVLGANFVEHMQDLRDAVGEPVYITSGYRNPAYNAGVGGVEYSRHQYGDAADAYADGLSVEEFGVACDAQGADYVGLYEDGHTHCDWRNDTMDSSFYDTTGGPVVPQEDAAMVFEGGRWWAPATGFEEGEPFRRWVARDRSGMVLVTATGRSFQPPAGTATIEVRVGGRIERTREL